jgi:hypothetical protein
MGELGSGDFISDESFALAEAIARRELEDDYVEQRIIAELKGDPIAEKPSEAEYRKAIGLTALLLAMVEDPSMEVSTSHILETVLGDGMLDGYAQDISKMVGIGLSGDVLKKIIVNMVEARSGGESSVPTDEHARLLSAKLLTAREIASEHNRSVTDVITDDVLFSEFLRRTNELSSVVEYWGQLLDSFDSERYAKAVIPSILDHLPEDAIDGLEKEEVAAFLAELERHPEVLADLTTREMNMTRESIRQKFTYIVIRL